MLSIDLKTFSNAGRVEVAASFTAIKIPLQSSSDSLLPNSPVKRSSAATPVFAGPWPGLLMKPVNMDTATGNCDRNTLKKVTNRSTRRSAAIKIISGSSLGEELLGVGGNWFLLSSSSSPLNIGKTTNFKIQFQNGREKRLP
uniref:Uncharacterized protein n=1 Tax=Opuntia streptacantha TaxID=393608 RepID=A0A7C9A0Z6_OPUST